MKGWDISIEVRVEAVSMREHAKKIKRKAENTIW
jgi:hypothetical protein